MKKQLFLLLATTIVATTFAGCSCTGSKTATDTTTESTIESTTPTGTDKESESEQPTTTVADIETDSNITEIETTVEEPTTEQPTEAPTEAPTIEKEPEVKKDYEIVWSSNPYFFTKRFSDGTEKYYFTYRANIEMSGKETTAIGVIPPEEIPYLDYEPDYYINGQTGNPYANSNQEEHTTQSQDNTTGSSNQTENKTEQSTYPPISSGQEDYDKESFEDFINNNGVTMQP